MSQTILPKKILGVDPGTNILGYAIIDAWKDRYILHELGVVRLNHLNAQNDKLGQIFIKISKIIALHRPSFLAIEAPFYGKNVQSMLKLGRAQGVVIAAGIAKGLEVEEYSPKKIKQSITGNGNASKEQVSALLSHIFKRPLANEPLDATDALAVALCHHFQSTKQTQEKTHYNSWEAFINENKDRLK